jgi:hypothetical protein
MKIADVRGILSAPRLLLALGLFVAAHFGLCYIIPQSGAGSFLFPFGRAELHDGIDHTVFGHFGGMPFVLMLGIAGLAVLAFCAAFAANFGWYVPAEYCRPLVLTGAVLSGAIYLLHWGPRALLPLAIDAALAYAVLASGWASLQHAH